MKNPFKRFKHEKRVEETEKCSAPAEEMTAVETEQDAENTQEQENEIPDDGFVEWGRSRTHGGIERRERNDIFEEYDVYGADSEGRLTCRRYHRYPEHERDFALSYSRTLTTDEFNRRLLNDLDRDHLTLDDYRACMEQADTLCGVEDRETSVSGFSESEIDTLKDFCEAIDTLKEKSYLYAGGVFRCESESVVDTVQLNLRFRKPLKHDTLSAETLGVKKEAINGYDIEDLWIMSVHNRLREHCSACSVMRIISEWSAKQETIYLMTVEGFTGIDGTMLVAVGEIDDFRRFGFFSVDFLNR